jgi:copper chaperone
VTGVGEVQETVALKVPGMSCGHCAHAVRTELGRVAGVVSVDVDLDSKDVLVHGTALVLDDLTAAVDEAGYEAQPA